jgi:plastocyanin
MDSDPRAAPHAVARAVARARVSARGSTGVARGTMLVLAALLAASLGPGAVAAGTLDVLVKDRKQKPLAEAVVSASAGPAVRAAARGLKAVVDQQDKEFVPRVKPIQAGTEVLFPNKDDIRHHVYSFSPAKRFELPLYKGTPAAPVLFDRSGVVVLGCNIHDWMVGYVVVLDTPFFGTTGADGKVQLTLPAGAYEVRVWHPSLRDERDAPSQPVSVGATTSGSLNFILDLKPEWRIRRAPSAVGDRYR